MGLFQKSVLNKYLKQQEQLVIEKAYKKFTHYFHNAERQQNIRDSKEEQFQEGFLRELFVKVLGYTLNPEPHFNLTTELKNEKGAKKTDGAILKEGNTLAVIELKSTKTADLEKVRQQAFDYKANQSECVYVITSNFEKLRFYINNAVDFEEFNLFTLNQSEFELLFLCLAKDNLLGNLPLKIKEASLLEEENITKKFYADYSLFKRELFRDLVKRNSKNAHLKEFTDKNIKLTLFKKTQKLLDRFLFVLFAEDRGLLPPNSISKILDQWSQLKEMDAYAPLYERYQKYFGYLNTGWKGKDHDIFAYNGGLFLPDPILDAILIDDELLAKHTAKLTKYDFESQVDVNILGHIFEHSLNEIESVNAEIEGVDFDKQKTKRKKDGVFYTPKYITKYIVDNTVGKLCEEKKTELEIDEADYFKDRKGRHKETLHALQEKLNTYRNWLLQLTIVDPACGSGAFLNQALEFLIKEHHFIDELTAKLLGGAIVFQDVENQILENNIFGVDINEESVEIAKLSLWLRTAQKGRKLKTLSNNIKCGNSLIDDPKVAGTKAFNWQKEFPTVFAKGGFDVVIGNPPYKAGRHWSDKDASLHEYLTKVYTTAEYQLDLYVLFYERSLKILKKDEGILSFITPNTWFTNISSSRMRSYFLKNSEITQILDCSTTNVFEDAVVETAVVSMRYRISVNSKVLINQLKGTEFFPLNIIHQNAWLGNDHNYMNIYVNDQEQKLKVKIEKIGKPLGEFCEARFGVKIYEVGKGEPKQSKEDATERIFESRTKSGEDYLPFLEGKDINKFHTNWTGKWIKYGKHLAAPRKKELFQGSRLLVRRIMGERIIASWTDQLIISNALLHVVKVPNKFSAKAILGIISSSLMAFYFRKNSGRNDKVFPEIKVHELRSLPILNSEKSKILEPITENLINLTNTFYNISIKFQKYLQSKFSLETLSKKLQNWHELSFAEFIAELNKAIKKAGGQKLSKADEMEWMELFETKKAEAQKLKAEIDKIDKEIDQMVYELYGLTEDEIAIVESSIK